ncbi:AMP-binding enzyme family protein (macronuclear) [Tetrahymena thermophila SB210]|uniref:AMP-binding enzyme family protein n=1 Tax=Tetrahymena thermophila (strain SB210) TaxID=312017 RepID=Q24F44_TETTS|nr:AMP-binding enzyme family protein [Tetrahymena thermophila SB210]EAS06398.2 AMP-binding enzyme family protein [Tetrahymena thermophila SB210]|eukprot:XP_001026643.2 AMP-binding enzyme family protein [Tetrahymena thermophila SB210]
MLMSFSIVAIVLSYLVYLMLLLFNSKIDPKFRSQIFITDETTEVSLQDDLLAFHFQYTKQITLDAYQKQMNKTYLVPVAYFFYYGENTTTIQLNITKCSNSDLQDYSCIDYSNVLNYTLMQNGKQNVQTKIYLLIFACPTINDFKTTVPDNCASQDEINDFVNSEQAGLNLKLYTSQYNTTSQQNQVNYFTKLLYSYSGQLVLSTVYAQQQVTQISQGLIIQQQSQYSSPINYNLQNNISIQQENDALVEVELQMDQVVQQISIQFSTIPEILAQVNSVYALLLTFGFIFRSFSQKEILKEFFFVFLSNMYQDTYQKLLQSSKLIEEKPQSQLIRQNTEELTDEQEKFEKERSQNLFVPSFLSKFKIHIEKSQSNDFVVTNEKDQIQITENSKNNDQFFTTDREQSNQQSNSIFSKQTNLMQRISLGEQKDNQSRQTQLSKFKNSQLENCNEISNLSNNIINQNLNIKVSSDKNYEHLVQKLRNIQDAKIFEKAKKFIFSKRPQFKCPKFSDLWNKKKKEKVETFEFQSHKNKIEQQIYKQLSILDLYKDFLFIKKSIMMLLSKEQLAVMHLVGYSSEYQTDQKLSISNNKSYLEQQQDILNSQDLQSKYVQSFFQKFQKKIDIDESSEIDKRIISSTIKKQ